MFYLSILVMILMILIQVYSKSKKLLLFIPIFFSLLFVLVSIFSSEGLGILTKPYILFLIILWSLLIYKTYKNLITVPK